MRIKYYFVFILSLLLYLNGISQGRRGGNRKGKETYIKGYISGKILDSLTNTPIEFAMIELLSNDTGKQIDGTVTHENGSFKLTDVKTGKYKLKVSYISYNVKVVNDVNLTLSSPDKKMGKIFISPSEFLLNEVKIVDQRTLIESKIDKMVYNVAKDPTLVGGDATDVLRKVPMLTVDIDGNVSLRGSKKVKILLNGKPSGMFSDDVGDALQMFPADEIKKVEVLTSPGAKYDGEGSAGIINIVTKKGIIKGIKGSVKTFLGDKMENMRGSLAIGKGRFGANTRIGIRYKLPKASSVDFYREQITKNGVLKLTKHGESSISRLGLGGVLGAFYDVNAYNSLNTSLRLRGRTYSKDGLFAVTNIDFNGLENVVNRDEQSKDLKSIYSWNTDYTRKFKINKDKLLVFAVQLEGDFSKDENQKVYSDRSDFEKNTNDGTNNEFTFQIDYTQPVNKAVKIEIGGKTIIRKLKSDFERSFENKLTGIDSIDNNFTDIFNYDQGVYSGYLSTTISFPQKIGIIAGLRYEKTKISGLFDKFNSDFSHDYDNILPSITISKRFQDYSTIKLSYSERIHRPGLRHINPYINNIDPQNISYGNPQLAPELTKQIEMGYSKFLKGSMMNISVYYKYTTDVINSFLAINTNGISETSFFNIGKLTTYGVNVFSSTKLFEILEVRGNINVNNNKIEGVDLRKGLENSYTGYNAFLSSNLKLRKGWIFEVWGFLNSPKYTLQGKTPSFSMYSFGIQKEILKGKGKLGLRLVEPFNANKVFETELRGRNFYQINTFSIPFRSIGLTFSYRFGKLDFKSRKSAIKNDDIINGGGDEEGEVK